MNAGFLNHEQSSFTTYIAKDKIKVHLSWLKAQHRAEKEGVFLVDDDLLELQQHDKYWVTRLLPTPGKLANDRLENHHFL